MPRRERCQRTWQLPCGALQGNAGKRRRLDSTPPSSGIRLPPDHVQVGTWCPPEPALGFRITAPTSRPGQAPADRPGGHRPPEACATGRLSAPTLTTACIPLCLFLFLILPVSPSLFYVSGSHNHTPTKEHTRWQSETSAALHRVQLPRTGSLRHTGVPGPVAV
jgi:hypothetical protein